jgi:hypothetical protein
MELSIRGIVTSNFLLEIEEDVFNEACESLEFEPSQFKKFTPEQWVELRSVLIDKTYDFECNIDYQEIHDDHSVSVDEVHISDDDMTVVLFEKDGKFHSIDIE